MRHTRNILLLCAILPLATLALASVEEQVALLEKKLAHFESGRGTPALQACSGRLTLATNTPVTTTDQTAKGTLYFTPYQGSRISLYNGSQWVLNTFTERSLALSISADTNYDVFLYDNSSTLTLELSAAWTNDTTRADALVEQDSILVKSGATTRRYLGTIRGSGANTTEDSAAKRFVWNDCQRVRRPLSAVESANAWSYNNSSWRPYFNNTANRVQFVVGRADVSVLAEAMALVYYLGPSVGLGVDSTSANSASMFSGGTVTSGTTTQNHVVTFPSIGYHYVQLIESSSALSYYLGDDGGVSQGGLLAWIDG